MIIGKDNIWKKWYDNISGRILNIQNNDGSWNGHHCITKSGILYSNLPTDTLSK